ncbi:MAG: hypothetical protein ACR2OC_10520 [Solirubrobacterales bacterium]
MSEEHSAESSASRPGSARSPLQEISAAASRLREISERLAEAELADAEAEELAREASELAARGGALLDERLRELAERGSPDSDG